MRKNTAMIFIHWFYVLAPVEIINIGKNFVLWAWQFFSIGYLFSRLFAPWHKDISGYGRGFDLKRFLHVFGWNLISRLIGAILRIFVMTLGLGAEVIILFVILVTFLLWIFMPLVILALLLFGILSL